MIVEENLKRIYTSSLFSGFIVNMHLNCLEGAFQIKLGRLIINNKLCINCSTKSSSK